MDYVPLGRSGLKVSRACLGTVNFGTAWELGIDEDDAKPIINAFLDSGGNFIDTADNYGDGQSEEIVGNAVRGKRDTVAIATKAGWPQETGPNDRGLSRAHLTRALEASLRRLGTDYIDLYQCHASDPTTPIEETMATLDDFVRSGKVRYVGCSNFSASTIVEAQWAAERRGGTPLISLQPQYSLLARDIEADILPACERYGLGVLAWSPLGGGILAGRYQRGTAPEPGTRLHRLLASDRPGVRQWASTQLSDRQLDIADHVRKMADELDTTPAAVALAWVRSRPQVTAVIIGPRTLEQYEENVAGLDLQLPDDVLARLDDISGPVPDPITGQANSA